MTDRCSIEIRSDGSARLCGALTFETVPGLFREAAAHIADAADGQLIDLADVQAVDSAGLALLLEWQAAAGGSLSMTGAPSSLVQLARLSEATELLKLTGRETG